jgi:hypothetical protein
MRHTLIVCLALVGCHNWHGDTKPLTQTESCNWCCQQSADACRLENDHPSYYCPRGQQECVAACASGNENEMCVIQTNKQYAKLAPKPVAAGTAQASNGPPVAAVHHVAETARGECDNRGTWNLKIGDAKGHAVGCGGLTEVPRDVTFRIERQKDLYALRDLVPAPGWQDGFAIEDHADVCVVTLTRDNRSEPERAKLMTVQLSEKDGKVVGTFHYREEMLQPIDCKLDAQVSGFVEAPAPRAAPPMQLPVPPAERASPAGPPSSTPRIGAGTERTAPGQRTNPKP